MDEVVIQILHSGGEETKVTSHEAWLIAECEEIVKKWLNWRWEREEERRNNTTSAYEEISLELPSLSDIVLRGGPTAESEWILVYAYYCSEQGRQVFSKDQIRDKYRQTNRLTISNHKNLAINVKSLESGKYIAQADNIHYRMLERGKALAKALIFGGDEAQLKTLRKKSHRKRAKIYNYPKSELSISLAERENLAAFYKTHQHDTNYDKVTLAAYWINQMKGVRSVNKSDVFAILSYTDEIPGFDISASLQNAKKKLFFAEEVVNGYFSIHPIGENYVKKNLALANAEK